MKHGTSFTASFADAIASARGKPRTNKANFVRRFGRQNVSSCISFVSLCMTVWALVVRRACGINVSVCRLWLPHTSEQDHVVVVVNEFAERIF